jgi:hypothetical protein
LLSKGALLVAVKIVQVVKVVTQRSQIRIRLALGTPH